MALSQQAGLKIATHGFAFFRARLRLIRKAKPFLSFPPPPPASVCRGRSRCWEDIHNPYSVEQKNGVRCCYRGRSCWQTFFLHSTVHNVITAQTLTGSKCSEIYLSDILFASCPGIFFNLSLKFDRILVHLFFLLAARAQWQNIRRVSCTTL